MDKFKGFVSYFNKSLYRFRMFIRDRFNNIRYKVLFLTILIVLVPMLATGSYFYKSVSGILSDNAEKEFVHLLEQINGNLEAQLGMINSTVVFFMSNPIIRESLEEKFTEEDSYSQASKKISIEKQLQYLVLYNYLWDSKAIKSIYVFEDVNTYYHVDRFSSASLSDKCIRVYGASSLTEEGFQIFAPTPDDPTIYFVRTIKSINTLEYIGTIVVAIDADSLSKLYSGLLQYKNMRAFVMDGKQRVLMDSDKSMLGKKPSGYYTALSKTDSYSEINEKGEDYFVVSKAIEGYNWTSIIAVPKKEVFSKLSNSIYQYIKVILYILVLFSVLSIFLSSRILKPIKDLMKRIEYVRRGDLKVKMPVYKDNDLGRLSDVFNKMVDEIQYLINDVYKKQLLLKESELKSLQSQINPHFLFNVLDTISWHARMLDVEEINKILMPFSRILRANITMSDLEKITISEELQYIEFYISIQESRFGDRLETEINVGDDSLKSFFLPKLCIQPIVENAIVHGLEEKVGIGRLAVNIRMEEDAVVFEVIDNGVGFDTGSLCLNAQDTPLRASEKHTHIGLYNSNKRIKLLYGEQYRITIYSRINEGTTVVVRIPADHGGLMNV